MATLLFPTSVPNARTLSSLLDNERDYIITKRGQLILEPGDTQLIIPPIYEQTMAAFLWRDTAIRFVLLHAGELIIPRTLKDNLTVVLWYMDEVFNSTVRELKSCAEVNLDLRSKTFDEYLRIEVWNGRHEPTNVNNVEVGFDPDINHYDWESYFSSLGPIWSGKKNKYILRSEEATLENAEVLLFEMKRFYNPPFEVEAIDDKLRKERKREMRRQKREEREREREMVMEIEGRDEWYISEVEDEEKQHWRDYDYHS